MANLRRYFKEVLIPLLRKVHWLYFLLRKLYRLGKTAVFEAARRVFRSSIRIGPPVASFSCYNLVTEGDLQGKILLSGQQMPTTAFNSLRALSGLGQMDYQPWPVFWSHHPRARLIGQTLVILDENKRASLEGMFGQADNDPAFNSLFRSRPVELKGPWTSIVSLWCLSDSYYHWFLDGITRLALLSEFPPDTQVIVPAKQLPYETETLRMLGLEHRVRKTPERHLLIEDYYFSAPSAMTGCSNPLGIQFLRSKLLPHAEKGFRLGEKIFLQRKGAGRGIRNETELTAFLISKGWTIIVPQELSLAQQIAVFSQARAVCSVHGSALTNLLWARPETYVLELIPQNFLNGCYESIAASIGLDYHYLLCDSDSAFCIKVDLAKLEALLPK